MNIPLKKVTIVTENVLREGIIKIIRKEGGTGHTITACEGEGSKGIHASDWEGRNIQIETIVNEETANKILTAVSETYMKNYALIAYISDVLVLRKEKFSPESQK